LSHFGNSALVVLYMLVVLYRVQHLLRPGRLEGVVGFAAVRSVLEAMFGPLAGDILAGWLGGFWSTTEKARFFLMIAAVAALASAALWALSALLRSAFNAE
jgi:hypothetical protein